MNDKIYVCWTTKGKKHHSEIDRKQFFNIMKSLKEGFGEDNAISAKFVEIIPSLVELNINFDINETKDVPLVQCTTEAGVSALSIIRHHKIIWAILQGYCQ